MTVLPTVRAQLLLAAERQGASAPASGQRRRGPRLPRLPQAGELLGFTSVAVAVAVAAVAVVLLHGAGTTPPAGGGSHSGRAPGPAGGAHRAGSGPGLVVISPLQLPSLRPGERCPTSPGHTVHNRYFNGVALGTGPVRVLLADRGNLRHGRVDIGRASSHSMHAIQTLWFALPRYRGPFEIRGGRLGRHGRIEVKPGANGLTPGSGPLVVQRGASFDSFPNGDRTVPGSTWVSSPGCYAWQVDGTNLSEVIVFDAVRPPHGG